MRKKGNEKYLELLKFTEIPNCEKYATKRILQEVHLGSQTVISLLDCNLNYLRINKYGRSKEFNLVKSRFEKSSKKLFERCDENLDKIMGFNKHDGCFFIDNGVRLTFITDKGNYSISDSPVNIIKQKIAGQAIAHFLNLMNLTDRNRSKQ
ncbi:MAG: hypothetical protein KDC74_01615 [Flavobacteriaceae bacterium]|nr:hypothetical protein [Flavobacteriaceae bacterium]